jgi:anti-sigma-K factor RskA
VNSEPNNDASDQEAQLADYALGVLDPAVAAELERSLAECRDRVLLAQQYSQVVGMLGYAVNPAEPPEGHKSRFMARLGSTTQASAESAPSPAATFSGPGPQPAAGTREPAPRSLEVREAAAPAGMIDLAAERARRRPPVAPALAATVAAALLLVIGAWGWSAKSEADAANARLATITSALKSAAPGSLAFNVQGKDQAANSWAFALVNPRTGQAELVASDLSPLSPAQVYEMWWLPADTTKTPVAAGVFKPDPTGTARHQATAPGPIAGYMGVAVTIEPEPGQSKPTGPIVLVGTYSLP